MICYHCGKEVGEIDAFCPYCGTKLNNTAPAQSAMPAPVAPAPAKMSALAAVGFSLACLAFVLCIISFAEDGLMSLALLIAIAGLVLSIVGLKKNNRMGQNKTGHGLASAGIALSAAVLSVVVIMFLIVAVLGFTLLGEILRIFIG